MSRTTAIASSLVARLRHALAGRGARGAVVGLALLLGGMQLALQVHSVGHDLLPANHQVCEQCVVAKASTPPPTIAAVLPLSPLVVHVVVAAPSAPSSRAPLIERSRGPPALV